MGAAAKRWLAVVSVCLAIALLGWVVSSAELSSSAAPIPKIRRYSEESTGGSGSAATLPDAVTARPVTSDPGLATAAEVVSVIVYALLIAGVIALIGYGIHRLLTTRPSGWDKVDARAATQPDAEDLREALRAGLSDIDSGGDPRKAVIACWLRLEHAAAEAGVARLESETPSDLVRRVLAASQVDDRALEELAAAYHRARYAPHEVVDTEREAARAALSAVDSQLAAPQAQAEPP
ncbi:MAG: DUF4129 domain-containing protein [Stackebrandtia sp.]